jgi:hypothetical protein
VGKGHDIRRVSAFGMHGENMREAESVEVLRPQHSAALRMQAKEMAALVVSKKKKQQSLNGNRIEMRQKTNRITQK